MINEKYVLGMGDTEYLSDGIFESEKEAHDEARRMRLELHDEGVSHSVYTVARVIPSTELAKQAMGGLTNQTAEFFTMVLGEVESFGDMDGEVAEITEVGKAKLEAVLIDILENDTVYPNSEAIQDAELFDFVKDGDYTVDCLSCSMLKYIPLSLGQKSGLSETAEFTCIDCQDVIKTKYDKKTNTLISLK